MRGFPRENLDDAGKSVADPKRAKSSKADVLPKPAKRKKGKAT